MVWAAQDMKLRLMPEDPEELQVAHTIGQALAESEALHRRTSQAVVAARQVTPVAVVTGDIRPETVAARQAG